MSFDNASWQAIASVALIGTARKPLMMAEILPMTTGKLQEFLPHLEQSSTEATLLKTAATLALYQQAGWVPPSSAAPAAADDEASQASRCDRDDLPHCNATATRLLQQMLQGEFVQVLPEWLASAAQRHQRLPEFYLPELLDLGTQQRDLWAAILPVLGKRGRWLAQQNPDWKYAVEMTMGEEWETGNAAARLLYLEELRSHHSERARGLLTTTWKQEGAGDRAKFLATFRTGLSMADEPFLEEALNDRAKDVRRIAADLLAHLAGSRLCLRMIDRINCLVEWDAQKAELQVTLPVELDAAMLRDGIGQEITNRNIGDKSNWLLQMISVIPPDFWQQKFKKTPTELIQLAASSEWKVVLLDGWAKATQRHSNADWGQALFSYSGQSARGQAGLSVLSNQAIENLCIDALQSNPGQLSAVLWMLERCRHPWSMVLGQSVLQALAQFSPESNTVWQLRAMLPTFALFMSPMLIAEATTLRNQFESNSTLAAGIEEFLTLLQFRAEILQAFELNEGISIDQEATMRS